MIIHADIVFSEDREHLAVHPDSYIIVEQGRVKAILPEIPEVFSISVYYPYIMHFIKFFARFFLSN